MRFGFDNILGVHQQTTLLREKRAEILASNIANADTPNYKAKDLNFDDMLRGDMEMAKAGTLKVTNKGHIAAGGGVLGGAEVMYRVPLQPSLDGNTVETHVEQSQFGENAVKYQASLHFLDRRLKGLIAAFRGE